MTDAWLIACTWSVRRTMLEKPQLQATAAKICCVCQLKAREMCGFVCGTQPPTNSALQVATETAHLSTASRAAARRIEVVGRDRNAN